MSAIATQVADSVRQHVERLAATDGISGDRFYAAAAEKFSVLETADYIARGARAGNNTAFDAVPAKVPAGNPEEERDPLL